jgi:hypothetical protein
MKFSELHEQDRIQYVKDGFILILEQLAKDPTKLKTYIRLEQPKLTVAAFESLKDSMSEEEIALVKARNVALEEKVKAANEKLTLEFKAKEEIFKKIEDIISKLQKKEGCLCGSCVNINITNSMVPPELEILIDAARKEAEERSY